MNRASCSVPSASIPGAVALALVLFAGPVLAQPCQVVDNGTGTVDLPPPGCGYVSPDDFHMILDGVPPGTSIRVDASHDKFFNVTRTPGGNLGGEVEQFSSILTLQMTGDGIPLSRTIFMQIQSEVHTGPRNAGDPVQTFPNEMVSLSGELFGDPDFDLLRIRGGGAFGLPSPGQTTLTELPTGNFNVDSFFDITYQIEFQGAPGSVLDGMAGTTTATVRMAAGEPAPGIPPCVEPDNGTGTVTLPPPGCGYLSPDDVHVIIDGLPPGTEIQLGAEHARFFNITATPGGNLGGEVETFSSDLNLDVQGTGALAGFQRQLTVPLSCEAHTGPRNPGDPLQDFDNDMFRLQGELFGDPDFCTLRVTGGTDNGLPSPGHTTLTRLPSGNFNVDSFFDITYQIEFQGCPGSQLDGFGGTTTGQVRMQSGQPSGNTCPPIQGGQDLFPSTAKLVLNLFDGQQPFVLRMSSAGQPDTIVNRQTQVGDTIDAELSQIELEGVHPRVGRVHVSLDPAQPSLGQLTNIVQDPTTCELVSADSFFDVIVDIQLLDLTSRVCQGGLNDGQPCGGDVDCPGGQCIDLPGQSWSCGQPLRIEAPLTGLPPRDVKYENPFLDPVLVIDNLTGEPRGEILYHLHHTDPPFPPPGPNCFDTFLSANINVPPLGQLPFQGQGPTTVQRSGPFIVNGACCGDATTPCQDDGDCFVGDTCCLTSGIDNVLTEMQMEGFDPGLGPVIVRLNRDAPPSGGQTVSRQPNRTYFADSFFDVFIEVEVPDQGLLLHNPQPITVSNIGSSGKDGVSNTPPDPGTEYLSPPGQPFDLFDPGGQFAGQISDIVHDIGPPLDWLPPPPPDEDCFESWLHLQVTLYNPFCEDDLWLHGDFRVLRDAPIDPSGLGQEIIATLVAKGVFPGNSDCFGPLRVRLRPDASSLGAVESLAPAEFFPADSFFDIFVEIDTGIGVLRTQDPTRMTTTINDLPPDDGEIYFGPGTVIPLYDDTGTQIGEILEVSHQVHEAIECPAECRPQILQVEKPAADPAGAIFDLGIPESGGGILYDVARGTLSALRSPTGFGDASCVHNNQGGQYGDTDTPDPGDGFYYVARDRFAAFEGTYSSSNGSEQCCRDDDLTGVCPP